MSLTRIFIAAKLFPTAEIALDKDTSNHVVRVLRLQPNDQLIVFNGEGGEFNANVKAITKQQAIIVINDFIARNSESPLQIHLGQGISRGDKMDLTIQKAVELGVTTITPLFTEYCNVKLQDERLLNKLNHWQKIAIHASEQSGRTYIPKVLPALALMDWLSKAPGLRLTLDPYAADSLAAITNPNEFSLLIGPEGGLSAKEIAVAKNQQFLGIKLGPRILRTETAALAAISVLQSKWGDWR